MNGVKIGNPPNYLIQVFPTYTDGDPLRAALYDGMYSVTLTGAMEVTVLESPLLDPMFRTIAGRTEPER